MSMFEDKNEKKNLILASLIDQTFRWSASQFGCCGHSNAIKVLKYCTVRQKLHLCLSSPWGHYYFMLVMALGAVSLGVYIRRKMCTFLYLCESFQREK